MSLEIERKFLVKEGFKEEAFRHYYIVQGYISSSQGRTVRIRIRDEQAFLTIKGPSNAAGISRFEWEKEITADDARQLLVLTEPGLIDKTRYLVKNTDGKHVWEVDEFHGANEGLVMAEIELSSEDEPFDRPAWLGEEVTGDRRYYNSHLSKLPYSQWK